MYRAMRSNYICADIDVKPIAAKGFAFSKRLTQCPRRLYTIPSIGTRFQPS
jgi:hypothetical protein